MLRIYGQRSVSRQLCQRGLHHELSLLIHRYHHSIQVLEVPLCHQHPVTFLEGSGAAAVAAHGLDQGCNLVARVCCLL